METQISTHAPVIVATLNRFIHFKRCLESLEQCTGSDQTEVYVALDYPPSDQYKEGWESINTYLKEREDNNGFKHLHVIRRDHNYGICHENGNYESLIKEIEKKYDRFILTEDDNEFAPNFLQYMNKALERFYDDERIFLVCGYNYKMDFPDMYRNNFYITKHGCPWGTGQWVHKNNLLHEYESKTIVRSVLRDGERYKLIKERAPHVIPTIVSMLKNDALWGDAIKGLYSTLYDKYCLMPRESLVRNWGNDGTGDHSKKYNGELNDFYTQQPISEKMNFEFTDDIFTYEPLYLKRNHYKRPKTLKGLFKKLVLKLDICLLRYFNYLPKTKFI